MNPNPPRESRLVTSILLAGAVAALPMSGCGNEEARGRAEADQQIREAAFKASQASVGASYPAAVTPEGMAAIRAEEHDYLDPMERRKRELQAIIDAARPTTGMPEQKAALHGLRTDAAHALSMLQQEQAERAEAELNDLLIIAGAYLDEVIQQRGMLSAAQRYDVAESLGQIDRLTREAQTRLARDRRAADDLRRRINDLETRRDAQLQTQARLSTQSAEMRDAAREAPLDDRLARIDEAARVGRQADSHQVAAAHLEAQLDVLRPDLGRLAMLVAQSESEIAALAESRRLTDERTEHARREAGLLNTDWTASRDAFLAIYEELLRRLDNDVEPMFRRAIATAEESLRDAQRAGPRGGPDPARLASGQQQIGRIQWRLAQTLDGVADFVERVIRHGADLGREDRERAVLEALRSRASQANETAAESFTAALDRLETISVTGDDARRQRDSLVRSLRQSIAFVTGTAVAEARDYLEMPDLPPELATVVTDTPHELLRTAQDIAASGRVTELLALHHAADPQQQQALQWLRSFLTAIEPLEIACREELNASYIGTVSSPRFEQVVQERLRANPVLSAMTDGLPTRDVAVFGKALSGGQADLTAIDPETVHFEYDRAGTTAWVEDVPALEGLDLIHVGGRWLFKPSVETLPDELGSFGDQFVGQMSELMGKIAQRVRGGQYRDEWAMAADLVDEFFAQMVQMMMDLAPPGFEGEPFDW